MEIRKLNMLRGVAALIVVVSHFSNRTNLWEGALGSGAGQVGVMLFFVLSGFLMSHLYLNKEFTRKNVWGFGIARVARVVPLFVLVVFVSYFLHTLKIDGIFYEINSLKSLISHLCLLSGVSVLWTIPTEIHFYILFILLWGLYSWRPFFLFTLMAGVLACLVFLDFPNPEEKWLGFTIQISILRSLPYFFAGMIFGQIYRLWRPAIALRKNVFVLTLLLVFLMCVKISQSGMTDNAIWADVGIFFVISVVFFALIFFVPDDNRLLSNRVGDFLGKISYSLYLLHIPVFYFMRIPARQNPVAFLFIFIVVSLVVASISYMIIEAPARAAIRSLARRRGGGAASQLP